MRTRHELTSAAFRIATGSLVAIGLGAGCQAEGDEPSEAVGQAAIELRNVPAEVRCIRIDVTGSARSLSRKFDVEPGDSVTLALQGLPLGDVTFSGEAFAARCDEVLPTTVGEWSSDRMVASVEPGEIVHVMLVMRRSGRGVVDVSFEDDPPMECALRPPANACGMCGSERMTCDEDTGEWVPTGVCEGEGVCEPGRTRACGPHGTQVCGPDCDWDRCVCRGPTSECDGQCVDLGSDPLHCGRCGQACGDGLRCEAGACVWMCPPDLLLCQADCVDPRSDPNHCGGCETVCGAAEVCRDGTCVP